MSRYKWKLFLFFAGLTFILLGYFGDNAAHIYWVMEFVSPASVNAIYALNILASNDNFALTPEAKGFNELLEFWPNMNALQSVNLIKRSVAYLSLRHKVKGDFQLIAYDEHSENEIGERWTEIQAREFFLKKQESCCFLIKTILFITGFMITLFTGLFEFLGKIQLILE